MLGLEPVVHPTARIIRATLGAWTQIGEKTSIVESSVGDYSYLVDHCQVLYATVGKFCSIASHVRINAPNHAMWRASQHHMTYRRIQYGLDEVDDEAFFDWRRADQVTVGHDVWIGHGAILLPGVAVGHGAVVAAGAVVSKDVAPYTIVGGVPSKPIRERFPRDVQEALLQIAWWDWTRAEIEARFQDFLLPIDQFCERYT
ncbi:MAG: chloramphenicol acetyltransferase [Dehalococcoidia bacterium]|nr:MAG: chloramphenicol acetyltransferase [Dehalococcoidia bacterium]